MGGIWDLAIWHGTSDVSLYMDIRVCIHSSHAGIILLSDEVRVLLVDSRLLLPLLLLDQLLRMSLILQRQRAMLIMPRTLREAMTRRVDFSSRHVGLRICIIMVMSEIGKGLRAVDGLVVALHHVVGDDCVEVLGPVGLRHELGG